MQLSSIHRDVTRRRVWKDSVECRHSLEVDLYTPPEHSKDIDATQLANVTISPFAQRMRGRVLSFAKPNGHREPWIRKAGLSSAGRKCNLKEANVCITPGAT